MKTILMKYFRSGVILIAVVLLATTAYSLSGRPGIAAGDAKEELKVSNKGPVSVSGITLELIQGYQVDDHFQVEVCYSLPDQRDWLISISSTDTLLRIDGEDYPVSETGMVSRSKGSDGKYNLRCEALLFPVQRVTTGSSFQVTISKIFVSEPETIDCTALQRKIESVQSGIEIQCANEPHMSGFHVISWPNNKMTQKMANELAHNIANDAHIGPWVLADIAK